jgi:hypothetical protein
LGRGVTLNFSLKLYRFEKVWARPRLEFISRQAKAKTFGEIDKNGKEFYREMISYKIQRVYFSKIKS